MSILHRRSAKAVTAAAGAILVVASGAMAGVDDFGPTTVLRTAPAGRATAVDDIAMKTGNGVVVWSESDESDGDVPRIRYRLTTDGGDSFGDLERVDSRASQEPSADVCAGYSWIAYGLHTPDSDPGEWEIALAGHRLDQPTAGFGALLTDPFESDDAHFPDVACIGNRRHIIAWVNETGFTDDIHIAMPSIFPNFKDPPPEYEFGPFSGHTSGGVAAAATGTMAYAAWVKINPDTGTERLQFKRFDVGPGADAVVTPHAILNPATQTTPVRDVQLAAHGSRVVLAYVRGENVWVQISNDYGASFGARRKVIDPPDGFATAAWSVTVRDSHIVLEGIELYGDFSGVFADPVRASSTNGGSTWSTQHPGGNGAWVGVLAAAGPGGGPHLYEAWDNRFTESPRKVRFHAEE